MDDLRSINSDGTAQAARTPASVGRDLGLDVAKGIAIACVVIGHVIRGFQSAGLLEYNLFLQILDNFVYGFHVQLFFIISIYISYTKTGSLYFQLNRNAFLYYCYIIWSLLSWFAGYLAGSSVNHRPELSELYAIPYVPYAHFWFLLALIITLIVAGLLRRTWLLVAGMLVSLDLLAAGMLGWCQLNYFLLFGLAGGAWRSSGLPLPAGRWIAGLGIGSLFAAALYAALADAQMQTLLFVPASLVGCLGILACSKMLAAQPMGAKWLATIGRASLPIYLLHVFAASGIRIILYQIWPDLPAAIGICAAIAGGVALPVLAQGAARRLGLAKAMGLDTFSILTIAPSKSAMPAASR